MPNTEANRRKALAYLDSLQGSGGTEMMKAINACLAGQDDPERVRIVCFMTDGCVGNDMAIIDAVQQNAGTARVFAFGIGTSVNRYLLDGIARAGRGEVQYILDRSGTAGAAERFYERVRTPVLTDVQLDFGGLAVAEVYPKADPRPVQLHAGGGQGPVQAGRARARSRSRGKTGEGTFQRKIDVQFPGERAARTKCSPRCGPGPRSMT